MSGKLEDVSLIVGHLDLAPSDQTLGDETYVGIEDPTDFVRDQVESYWGS